MLDNLFHGDSQALRNCLTTGASLDWFTVKEDVQRSYVADGPSVLRDVALSRSVI